MFCRWFLVNTCKNGWLIPVLLGLLACGREPAEQKPLETVDVTPQLELDISQDETQSVAEPTLVGVLPTSFPTDLPIFLPASLIDFGQNDRGARYVELLSPVTPASVEQELGNLLRRAGWQIAGNARAGATVSKGNRQVRWRLQDAKPGTVCRYEY